MKTRHPAERRVGRLVERLFQPRKRFLVSSDLRQRHREQRADVRQRRLQLQRFLQRRHSVGKPPLLKVDEAQPRVDLGDTGLELAHARVGLLGLGVTPLGERAFTLFVQGLHLGRISRRSCRLRSPGAGDRCRQAENQDGRGGQSADIEQHRSIRALGSNKTAPRIAEHTWRVSYRARVRSQTAPDRAYCPREWPPGTTRRHTRAIRLSLAYTWLTFSGVIR